MPARLCKDCVCGYGSPVDVSPSSSSSSLPEVARASSAPTDSSVEGGRGVVRTLPDGTRCYIAVPPTPLDQEYAAKQMQQLNAAKAILFCSNVFGIELVANRLLADKFAEENNVVVLAPDLFQGDSLSALQTDAPDFDLYVWQQRHGQAESRPPLDAAIAYARESLGITEFAGVGYCVGARWLLDLAFDGLLVCGAINHPSLVEDAHLERLAGLDFPVLFNTCGHDFYFPDERLTLADSLWAKRPQYYKRLFWKNQQHGWSVRGGLSDGGEKAKQEAFEACSDWIAERL